MTNSARRIFSLDFFFHIHIHNVYQPSRKQNISKKQFYAFYMLIGYFIYSVKVKTMISYYMYESTVNIHL